MAVRDAKGSWVKGPLIIGGNCPNFSDDNGRLLESFEVNV